jgi:CheY-like chemotaxis protein
MAKIMLVEDDNNLRQIYEDRLAAEGYVLVSAKDGEEALAMAVKERPDLIIADIMMPKVSGFDMLDILRSTPETKDAKIIMMTALSQAEDQARAEKLGADKYLVKSQVTLEDVVDVANQMLGEQQAGADLTSTGAVTSEPTTVAAPAPSPSTPPSTASIPVTVAPSSAPATPPAPAATPTGTDLSAVGSTSTPADTSTRLTTPATSDPLATPATTPTASDTAASDKVEESAIKDK